MSRSSTRAAAPAALCHACTQIEPRVAAWNSANGPTLNLDLRPIVEPHGSLEPGGPGQARHVHEGTAELYRCRQCGAWWDFGLWYGVGYIYIDQRSAEWVKEWKRLIAPPKPEARARKKKSRSPRSNPTKGPSKNRQRRGKR